MTDTQPATRTDPLTIVTGIYAAFGRGDIGSILAVLADDVVFDDDTEVRSSASEAGHPLLTCHRGKAQVAEFFAELARYTMRDFQVTDLLTGDGVVAARVLLELESPAGIRMDNDEMHLWRVDDGGLVTSMRHYTDTAKHLAAMPTGAMNR